MSVSTINLPVGRAAKLHQWGIFDRRSNKVIRTHLTREKARNYARRSKHYSVVSRLINVGFWE